MEKVFLAFLQADVFASVLIALTLILRLFLRKAPRQLLCICWLLIMVRLLPISIESRFSLQPESVWFQKAEENTQGNPSDLPQSGTTQNPGQQPDVTPTLPEQLPTEQRPDIIPTPPITEQLSRPQVTQVLSVVWISVAAVGLFSSAAGYWRLKMKLRTAWRIAPGVMESADIQMPFLLGYLRPQIYLPSDVSLQERGYIIAHEQAHIDRGDHWWKLFGIILTCLHWYNPLVWIGYILFCRDTESACDERVICLLNLEERKGYAKALLNRGRKASGLTAITLCFGKEKLKQRIHNVLTFRKPGVWITLAAGMMTAVLAICFLTTPKPDANDDLLTPQDPTQGTTESTEPTEPTEPTVEPTEPTAEPTEPTEPTELTEPTEPTKPSVPVNASGTCGMHLTWTLRDNVLTVSGKGEIPDYASKELHSWSKYSSQIVAVEIGDEVQRVGENAFRECSALRSVKLGKNVTAVGKYAFAYTGLTSFEAPSGLRTIEEHAFYDCRALEKVVLRGGVESIKYAAFGECLAIKHLVIGESVRKMDNKAFTYAYPYGYPFEKLELYSARVELSTMLMRNLKTVVIGPNVPSCRFQSCPLLTEVTMAAHPDGTLKGEFQDCPLLTDIQIVGTVKSFQVFFEQTGMKMFTFPATVESITTVPFDDSVDRIIFLGNAPTFNERTFFRVTATAYYPADNPTWTEAVRQNYGGNITWIPQK